MKYIIKNCPAYYINTCSDSKVKEEYCSKCTDCVMKQIVELCEGIKCPCEYEGVDCWECTESGVGQFANKISELLDIQEVE